MTQQRSHWKSSTGFILAAAGSAVGVGNLWKFPFITWENNGGAFVIVYLLCIPLIGLPIMMAEFIIGRHTQKSAVGFSANTYPAGAKAHTGPESRQACARGGLCRGDPRFYHSGFSM